MRGAFDFAARSATGGRAQTPACTLNLARRQQRKRNTSEIKRIFLNQNSLLREAKMRNLFPGHDGGAGNGYHVRRLCGGKRAHSGRVARVSTPPEHCINNNLFLSPGKGKAASSLMNSSRRWWSEVCPHPPLRLQQRHGEGLHLAGGERVLWRRPHRRIARLVLETLEGVALVGKVAEAPREDW